MAQREQRGLVPMSKDQPASSREAQRVRWCFGCRNQESMKKTPAWNTRGQTGMDFHPHSRNRVSPGVTERIGYWGSEDAGGGKGPGHGTDGSSHSTFPAPSSLSPWLSQPFLPGSCYLEIKLFFTSTCFAEQDGGRRGPCLVPLCLPIIFSHKSGCELCAQPTFVQI